MAVKHNVRQHMEDPSDLNNIIKSWSESDESQQNLHSSYYDIEDLTGNLIEPHLQYEYHAMHINIQSLPGKFEKLKNLDVTLHKQGISLDFILLCETFYRYNCFPLSSTWLPPCF